jgi:hypothetical protein
MSVCLFVCPGKFVPGKVFTEPIPREPIYRADPTGTCLPSRFPGNVCTGPLALECVYRVVSSVTWLALLGLSVAVRCKRDELLRTGMHKDYLRFWKWSLFALLMDCYLDVVGGLLPL